MIIENFFNLRGLRVFFKNKSGRNCYGRITIWHRGDYISKVFYRVINYFYEFLDVPGVVLAFFKDFFRGKNLVLVCYNNGFLGYIPKTHGIRSGTTISTTMGNFLFLGDSQPLGNVFIGGVVHNVELYLNKGSTLSRSSGVFCKVLKHFYYFGDYFTLLVLPSGKNMFLSSKVFCTLGRMSSFSFGILSKKAGFYRNFFGRRPIVRGVAMNPVDHPHGGGEGKTSGGRPSVTPWGKLTKGFKTKKLKKSKKKVKF